MNDNELKKLWQQQSLRDPAISPAQVMSAMQKQTTQLRRTLLARDARELVACLFVGVVFGIYYFIVRAPIMRLGALITVAGAIFIAWKILHARRTTPAAKADATVVESLRAELHSVRTQSQLLRSIGWWYLLPLAVGTLVFVWGMPLSNILVPDLVFKIGFTLFSLAFDVYIYRLNQRARSKQLLPVEAQLEALLHSAETGEPLDETRVANLRPIVLSMAAAEKVKPAEFKVALWQIAIFGIPGIVGIWLFLMIGLTMDSKDWKTKEPPPPKTFGQAVFTGETNRDSIVARKVVDLFNAGDYAAVQKLYNPKMAKVFPPQMASTFYDWLATTYGRIEKFDGPIGKGYFGETAFQLHFQRGEMPMSLALDANDKISGIYFQTPPRPSANVRPFVLRFFSWQHLLWLPPFFLAGLLYSWLMQKLTRRAVGISTLGIHLCKGQNLILWDEIKEVRPLRILHVRNLWLIRESGEKTLMHWTPLERHSDLKAAVESFSPANHPIRKHLSLLNRKTNIMSKLSIVIIAAVGLCFLIAKADKTAGPSTELSSKDPAAIEQMLANLCAKNKLPAMAIAVVADGKIVATNAVGVRKYGGTEKVAVDDQFHLGSVTKSMTATVAAMLVEQGKISWTTTIGEIFSGFKDRINSNYYNVTLEQLLAQRGGVPGEAPKELWRKAWEATGSPAEQRLAFIKGILAEKPEASPGTKFIYSNQGYTIAGVMLEKASGKTWEELMRTMLFEPLGMKSAGFGAPATPGKVDQPWGHTAGVFSINPVPPGPGADNPWAISPAGAVHCSMADLAKYAAFHLAGERGEGRLLKPESFKKLHRAVGDEYALGWRVLARGWAGGDALMHNGSNTMFYVVVWIAPNRNFAVVVATNSGADNAFEACDTAASELIQQYLEK